MSNRNRSEILRHRKPKVSLAMIFIQGLVGSNLHTNFFHDLDKKSREKLVWGDVQQVNIPAPQLNYDGVTEPSSLGDLLDYHSLLKDACQVNPASTNPRVEKSSV